MPKRFVTVGSKSYEVYTQHTYKTVWKASGTFEGQYIEKKARSESAALRDWLETAKSRAL